MNTCINSKLSNLSLQVDVASRILNLKYQVAKIPVFEKLRKQFELLWKILDSILENFW